MPVTFADVAKSEYILLTTFTKDGRPKPTAIWAAPAGDRLVVITWYVAIVTGRISFTEPEYSPISSSVSEVRRSSSSFHCRAGTELVTRISVVAWACAIAAAPTSVFPAPHGSTTTPEPPCQNDSAASRW